MYMYVWFVSLLQLMLSYSELKFLIVSVCNDYLCTVSWYLEKKSLFHNILRLLQTFAGVLQKRICRFHSKLIGKEQKGVSEFFYFHYFSHDGLYCNMLCEFFNTGTWQIFKSIANRNKRKRWHPLDIDALWLELHSPFASTIAFHTRLIRCNISRSFWSWQLQCRLWKAKVKTEHNVIEFYIL